MLSCIRNCITALTPNLSPKPETKNKREMPFIACPRPSPLCLPGLGLPLDHRSEIVFPTALFQESHRGYESVPSNYPLDGHRPKTAVTDDRSCRAPLLAKREYTMMEIMNRLTDKPGWEEKIFREVVVRRWKAGK